MCRNVPAALTAREVDEKLVSSEPNPESILRVKMADEERSLGLVAGYLG